MNSRNWLFAAATATVLSTTTFFSLQRNTRGSEPQDLYDAVETIESIGLFWTTGAVNFPTPDYWSVTVSTEPITNADAALLGVGMPPARWAGKVRAYRGRVLFGDADEQFRPVRWGQLTLIGDPDLIGRIVSHR